MCVSDQPLGGFAARTITGQAEGLLPMLAHTSKAPMPQPAPFDSPRALARVVIKVGGTVQGVGFRPYVHRLADEHGLAGNVRNSGDGVRIEAEGERELCERFHARLTNEGPGGCEITKVTVSWTEPLGDTSFQILPSEITGPKRPAGLVDAATCADCRAELFTPLNRRYRYPFITCPACGPRFSIVEALPFDRCRTTMRAFSPCPTCQREYGEPLDRRYHSQTNSCADCGPRMKLWDARGHTIGVADDAICPAVSALREGAIVAVKGIGGFHLLVDACNENAVQRLRERKRRPERPLAVMFGGIDQVQQHCQADQFESQLLASPAAPIVLLRRSATPDRASQAFALAESVAPGNPYLGCFLPYTPVHHLLLADLEKPVVATSGNLSEEPICTDERTALQRLGGIADFFLVHDRKIVRAMDDSVVRVVLDRPLLLRRSRGYVPQTIKVSSSLQPALATGGQMKNTVAQALGNEVYLSQHLGDLDTMESVASFEQTVNDIERLFETEPAVVACDPHPDYASTRFAERAPLPLVRVQHHYAHILSCMADNGLEGPVLGVAWDGTGLGNDGTIWGGEFLHVDRAVFDRVAHLRPFPLPGGDAAARQPRRSAAGILFEMLGPSTFDEASSALAPHWRRAWKPDEWTNLSTVLARNVNSQRTSSMGRLFDAVASLLGVRQLASFEGQAAMEVEFAAEGHGVDTAVTMPLSEEGTLDWEPLVRYLLSESKQRQSLGKLARAFHNSLVETVVKVAEVYRHLPILLTGGCFQNALLLRLAVQRLREAGHQVHWHLRVPPGDGGLSLGQVLGAGRVLRPEE
jgi:hydrogenase maturation protein HypF